MSNQIYLDYNASTPLDPAVVEAIRPFLADHYANPSSHHQMGEAAKAAIQKARMQVADLLGCTISEVVFNSGGSESNNHAIKGLFWKLGLPFHILVSAVEHPAVLEPCRFLERLGAKITVIPVDKYCMVDPDEVRKAITPETRLITIMHANNEVGTIQPIPEISQVAREREVTFHSDAAQACGKIPTNVKEMGVDLATFAGHKIYGPKGIGALYVRKGVMLEPHVHGSGHEFGRRAGTENTIGIVAFGAACAAAKAHLPMTQTCELRDYFWSGLQKKFGDDVVLNGHPTQRLPNTLNVSFKGKHGAEVLECANLIAASTGSACHSGSAEISHVLKAMGLSQEVGHGAIRFSLGRMTTRQEIDAAIDCLSTSVR